MCGARRLAAWSPHPAAAVPHPKGKPPRLAALLRGGTEVLNRQLPLVQLLGDGHLQPHNTPWKANAGDMGLTFFTNTMGAYLCIDRWGENTWSNPQTAYTARRRRGCFMSSWRVCSNPIQMGSLHSDMGLTQFGGGRVSSIMLYLLVIVFYAYN